MRSHSHKTRHQIIHAQIHRKTYGSVCFKETRLNSCRLETNSYISIYFKTQEHTYHASQLFIRSPSRRRLQNSTSTRHTHSI